MRKNQFLLCLCWIVLLACSCKTSRLVLDDSQNSIEEIIQSNPLFSEDFSGIHVESIDDGKIIYQQYPDHRFIPASNIKILTLYAALEILDHKIPTFQYHAQGDSLWIWGTGDPAFLYKELNQDFSLFSFLQNRVQKTILLSQSNFKDRRFGAGWAWDDYFYEFQVEKSSFPIYGNRVTFQNLTGQHLKVFPTYFAKNSKIDSRLKRGKIIRNESDNQFSIANDLYHRKFSTARPFYHQPGLIAQLLTDTLKRKIEFDTSHRKLPKDRIIVERDLTDELYQKMMQESDNFIAEQLLLVVGGKLTGTLNTRQTIQDLEKTVFQEIKNEIRWVDGSGLSRYNLLSPRSIVWVLKSLSKKIPRKQLLDLFPAGGQSGSLKNWYGGQEQPYVFAKTGSLSGVYCLSGYLKTKKGKLLVISFMHNNFRGSSKKYKEAITPVLQWLYNH